MYRFNPLENQFLKLVTQIHNILHDKVSGLLTQITIMKNSTTRTHGAYAIILHQFFMYKFHYVSTSIAKYSACQLRLLSLCDRDHGCSRALANATQNRFAPMLIPAARQNTILHCPKVSCWIRSISYFFRFKPDN